MVRPSFFKALVVVIAALVAAPVAAAPGDPAERGYVLGADDTITVMVYGQPEAGVTTRIKSDGTIVMPLIGTIDAAGQTQIELANALKKKYVSGGFYKSPLVNVEVGAYQSKTVNVAGKVTAPGVYALDRKYRTLEMLLKSGWLQGAGANYIYLRRASDNKEVRLDVEKLVRGVPEEDPQLEPGDTLFIPDADTFYISGQVTRPGMFPISKNMTLRQALVIAGGVTASGSERKIALKRGDAKEVKADLDKPVERNDVYIVKERLF